MAEDEEHNPEQEHTMIETEAARSLLDQLFADSRLYTRSTDYRDLLDFASRLRNVAPFNAMLLQMQKPGLSYAASAHDWRERFGRHPKEGARPLLILWPFGPVALVYDVMDTEGDPLPEDVASFFARGAIDQQRMEAFVPLLAKQNIEWCWVDAGDKRAGSICLVQKAPTDKEANRYRMHINRNHEAAVQFTTLAHELAHLFLGHLGPDRKRSVPKRPAMKHSEVELEAESVAYMVCDRNGVKSKSQTYLSHFVDSNTTSDRIDVYQIMRAAGQVETILGLTDHTRFDKPASAQT